MNDLLTFDDVADLTGIKRNTLYQWRLRGKMPDPDAEIGSRVPKPLWNRETIEKWMSERTSNVD